MTQESRLRPRALERTGPGSDLSGDVGGARAGGIRVAPPALFIIARHICHSTHILSLADKCGYHCHLEPAMAGNGLRPTRRSTKGAFDADRPLRRRGGELG